jgi:hypothetical protein
MICTWLSNFRTYMTVLHITKLCRQAEVLQKHENANVRNIGQGEPRHRKYKRLKLGGKRQNRPTVRKSAPHQQACNCLTVIKIWS